MGVITKSDQENAITSVVGAVGYRKALLGGRWVVESSPVGSRQSKGVVERAMHSVAGQARVLTSEARGEVGRAQQGDERSGPLDD